MDVYSNSWGPMETGFYVGGPGYLTQEMFKTEALLVSVTTHTVRELHLVKPLRDIYGTCIPMAFLQHTLQSKVFAYTI